jgi:hypothetical protein
MYVVNCACHNNSKNNSTATTATTTATGAPEEGVVICSRILNSYGSTKFEDAQAGQKKIIVNLHHTTTLYNNDRPSGCLG